MLERTRRTVRALAAGCAASIVLAGCGLFGASDGGSQAPPSSSAGAATASSPAPSPPVPTSTTPAPPVQPPSAAQQLLAKLSPEQRIGQLLMVSSPVAGPDANTLAALDELHVGNVFLKGRSTSGSAAVSAVVAQLQAHATAASTGGARQFIATDQEGGMVQILSGPGFAAMPAALDQGAGDPSVLRGQAQQWGSELNAAGVNVNFAPVLDTVPSAGFAPSNAPVGFFHREYGYTPAAVSASGLAFAAGMAAAGVIPTVKHFPGLGRVTANTDTSSAVTDSITGRNDPYLAPFRDAVASGRGWVMVSNAYYPAIDPDHIAPFSPVVLTSMLREDLGYHGIIVSDDLCDAVQLAPFSAGNRAADFIAAGGTLALCTDQALVPQLYQGMLARYGADPVFAQQVDAAALLILSNKAAAKLL